MPVQINKVDTFQTRFFQSFVNLTKFNSSLYPAVTSVQIDQPPEFCSNCETLTAINIYDQWALRVVTDTAPLNTITA